MKNTTPSTASRRKAPRRMMIFVGTIAIIAAVIAVIYVLGSHPGDTASIP